MYIYDNNFNIYSSYSPRRHGQTLRHNMIHDSLTPTPTHRSLPRPTSLVPRTPLYSRVVTSALRGPFTQPQGTAHHGSEEQDLNEIIPLNPIKSNHLLPLAIEPTNDQSAAIATVLIQLPKCTSEPRSQQQSVSEELASKSNLPNSSQRITLDYTDSNVASDASPLGKQKCDIVPVTVGGGNAQTLSFGCVLISTQQTKSKYHARATKNLLVPSRNGQDSL